MRSSATPHPHTSASVPSLLSRGRRFSPAQWLLTGPLTLGLLFGAQAAPILLVAIGLTHLGWAAGIAWPSPSVTASPAYVIGWPEGSRGPAVGPTLMVSIVVFGLAYGLWVAHPIVIGATTVIFALRGVGGLFERWPRPSIRGSPYERLSLFFYSPLCMLIAGLAAATAGRTEDIG